GWAVLMSQLGDVFFVRVWWTADVLRSDGTIVLAMDRPSSVQLIRHREQPFVSRSGVESPPRALTCVAEPTEPNQHKPSNVPGVGKSVVDGKRGIDVAQRLAKMPRV